jgi:Tol biopolymer transport system component/predicted Ser/Thr protein kinase
MATRPMPVPSSGHYHRLEKLGEGGMGVVYKAVDSRLGRLVAIKVRPADTDSNPDRRRRFLQEARAASALNHPNIVTIHEITEEDGVESIVMEYVPGQTLGQAVAASLRRIGRGLPVVQALGYAVQIAAGLGRAHSAGIVHRDLKPANIMVRNDGLIKLLDFGLAKVGRAPGPGCATLTLGDDTPFRTRDGAIVGTAAYMSPEQIEGNEVDSRSDIFSFGLVLYEMLAGRHAFGHSTASLVMPAILRDEPRPLRELAPDTPPELERVVARCLRKEAGRRYQHVDDVRIALEEIHEETTRTATGSWDRVSADGRKRRRVRPAAVAATLALAAAIGGGVAWRLRERPAMRWVAEPVTSFPGRETEPAVSPDGKQVAFVWTRPGAARPGIHVQLIGAGDPLALTDQSAAECCPAWAPDGKHVYFIREHFDRASSGRGEIMVVPALGGPVRAIAEATIFGAPMSVSPDGRWLAVSGRENTGKPFAIELAPLPRGEKRRITEPAASIYGDIRPIFSPDSRAIAFVRLRSFGTGDVHRLDLDAEGRPAGAPVRLTSDSASIEGLDWSRDARSIFFTSNRTGPHAIWSIPASGGAPARALGLADGAHDATLAREVARLVWEHRFEDTNIWSIAAPGGTAVAPRKLIASTRGDDSPAYSPDGRRIAFISTRSGAPELWVAEADGDRAVALTQAGGPLIRAPSWSPDGQRLAFHAFVDRNWDIYTLPAEGGSPRRMTTEPSDEARATWSRDGRRIYFASNRSGAWELWRIPAEGGVATRVTHGGGYEAIESADGRTVYFTKLTPPGVWRAPVEGGHATEALKLGIFGLWAVTAQGIYVVRPEDATLQFHDFASGRPRVVARLRAGRDIHYGLGLTVSPDGRWIAYGQVDQLESDIMTATLARP